MTKIELANFCARVSSNVTTDMSTLSHELGKTDPSDRLSWALAHLNSSMVDYVRDLERMQEALSNAG